MDGGFFYQIGGLDEDPSLRLWIKNKQVSTSGTKELRTLQEQIRDTSVRRGDAQLHLAVRTGNLAQVKDIMRKSGTGGSKGLIWKKNSDGETALFIAAENGHAEIVHEILKAARRQSAAPNADNCLDAFHLASKLGHAGNLCLLFLIFLRILVASDHRLLRSTQ